MRVIYNREEANDLKKVVYVGVFLRPETKDLLKDMFLPTHEKVVLHHMTLCFGPSKEDLETFLTFVGCDVRLSVTSLMTGEHVEALTVVGYGPDEWLVRDLCRNEHPHITFSHAKGHKPFESNALLDPFSTDVPIVSGVELAKGYTELIITGRLGVFGK